jgi:hypothetical protein
MQIIESEVDVGPEIPLNQITFSGVTINPGWIIELHPFVETNSRNEASAWIGLRLGRLETAPQDAKDMKFPDSLDPRKIRLLNTCISLDWIFSGIPPWDYCLSEALSAAIFSRVRVHVELEDVHAQITPVQPLLAYTVTIDAFETELEIPFWEHREAYTVRHKGEMARQTT